MKILVSPTSLKADSDLEGLQKLRCFADEIVYNPYGRPMTEEESIKHLQGCQGWIAGLEEITENVLEKAPELKVISRYGVGYDRVDLHAAAKHGIVVANTPGANSRAVAELAFGMILSLVRKIPYLNQCTLQGDWIRSTGTELYGKQLGLIGLGAIGKIVAGYGKAFGMKVAAYDPIIDRLFCEKEGIQEVSLEELLRKSDVISLHVPLLPETYHLIDKTSLRMVKPQAVIVNTARGGLLDEAAVAAALEEGNLAGVGLDAFEKEPPKNSPLFGRQDVVVTPHTGAHTQEATDKMALLAVENLMAVLEGKSCRYIVNSI